MDSIKEGLNRARQHIASLSARQKTLIGSIVAIMVMTLVWWGGYAGDATLVPLLPQSFADADITEIKGKLLAIGVAAKVEADRILVPADRRDEAIAALGYANLLPSNTISGFDAISSKMKFWDSSTQTDALLKRGKEITLQNIIRLFPGVKGATVLIEPAARRRLGGGGEASATIHLHMKDGGDGDRKLANSAAAMVVGAQQGLTMKNARIVIGQKRYDFDEAAEVYAAHERHYEDKLNEMFSDIRGVIVKVTVDVSTTGTHVQNTSTDPDGVVSIQQPDTQRTKSLLDELGLFVNASASSVSDSPADGNGARPSEEEVGTKYSNLHGQKFENSTAPSGKPSVVAATVRVPRSHFLRLYKTASGLAAEPTAAALRPIVDAEIASIRKYVIACTHVQNDSQVMVGAYDDSASLMVASPIAAPKSLALTLNNHSKAIAGSALAAISLFLVTMIIRGSGPARIAGAMASVGARHDMSPLRMGGELIDRGFANVGDDDDEHHDDHDAEDSMLDGADFDREALGPHRMLDRVSNMVQQNPDGAADLVSRWMDRT